MFRFLFSVSLLVFFATSVRGIRAADGIPEATPFESRLELAYRAFNEGQFKTAAMLIAPEIGKGAAGSPEAWNLQGCMHFIGVGGVEQSEELAVLALQNAALGEDPKGRFNLGSIYYYAATHGFDDPDESKAIMHLSRDLFEDASRTVPEANYKLGLMQVKGHGFTKDIEAGCLMILKAARLGVAEAQFFVGKSYHDGQVDGYAFRQDDGNARVFYRMAAEKAHAGALEGLAKLSSRDKSAAYMYMLLASRKPDDRAARAAAELESSLTKEQRATAVQSAFKFAREHPLPPFEGLLALP